MIFRNHAPAQREPSLVTERDTVNSDGTFNRAAILRIATLRAAAERDIDVLLAAFGPALRLPTGISQNNIAAWRRERAAAVDRAGLILTPFRKLLSVELRRAWQAARAIRATTPASCKTATAVAADAPVREAA